MSFTCRGKYRKGFWSTNWLKKQIWNKSQRFHCGQKSHPAIFQVPVYPLVKLERFICGEGCKNAQPYDTSLEETVTSNPFSSYLNIKLPLQQLYEGPYHTMWLVAKQSMCPYIHHNLSRSWLKLYLKTTTRMCFVFIFMHIDLITYVVNL